ncbi:response regulator [Rugamonas apoptosis]|uniref:Response regulator n=1 Tax=Rugamonas apoptosis TaxID=2758570 RepID=A0A7W2FB74_9BURK|nr:response regulator [Rugamonas apoptosis]MBA5688506.1 response regulator [Rugamonas apoptosis]
MTDKPISTAPAPFCVSQQQLDEARAAHDEARGYGAAPRVLHVDSDHDAALVLAALLVPETQVTHAGTLDAAVRAVRSGRYALVVLDPDLPDGDGATLLHILCEQPQATPVLLYSGRQPERLDQGIPFLHKPWTSPRQLWLTVSRLLEMPSLATVIQPSC